MKFPCPHCSQRISAAPEDAGTEGFCPSCSQPFIVPAPPPEPEPVPQPPPQPAVPRPRPIPAAPGRSRSRRIAAGLIGFGAAVAGGILLWMHLTAQGTPERAFKAFKAAVVSGDANALTALVDPLWKDREEFVGAIMSQRREGAKLVKLRQTSNGKWSTSAPPATTNADPNALNAEFIEAVKSVSIVETKVDGDLAAAIIRETARGKAKLRGQFFVRRDGKWFMSETPQPGDSREAKERLLAWHKERRRALESGTGED